MTHPTAASRLARLEARQRREALVLARYRRRERLEATRRELRLGAALELVGGEMLDPARLADWLDRAAASARGADLAPDELHRRGDAHLLALAASRAFDDRDASDTVRADERERRTADRTARGALVVAAGLGELPRTVMIGLLLSTAPDEIGGASDASDEKSDDDREGDREGSPYVSGDGP